VGTLSEGAAADVILVDYLPPTPLHDAPSSATSSSASRRPPSTRRSAAGGSCMHGRRLEIGLDEEALAAESRRLATALWERF
jgi:hypothetical protein